MHFLRQRFGRTRRIRITVGVVATAVTVIALILLLITIPPPKVSNPLNRNSPEISAIYPIRDDKCMVSVEVTNGLWAKVFLEDTKHHFLKPFQKNKSRPGIHEIDLKKIYPALSERTKLNAFAKNFWGVGKRSQRISIRVALQSQLKVARVKKQEEEQQKLKERQSPSAILPKETQKLLQVLNIFELENEDLIIRDINLGKIYILSVRLMDKKGVLLYKRDIKLKQDN